MPGLAESRWASGSQQPRVWSQTLPQPTAPVAAPPATPVIRRDASTVPEKELARFLKLVARLKWKLPYLAQGYRLAVDRPGRPPEDVAANEIHFKIDFYEYYMHIERALVHLMGVFGIRVYGLMDSVHNPINDGNVVMKDGPRARLGMATSGQHRYHANVLHALDNPSNPLHEALGTGDVRLQLARAKELRNRWKNADEVDNNRGYEPAPLESYNLEQILTTIFDGFERGVLVAQAHVEQHCAAGPVNWDSKQEEDSEWSFVVDAMDWEAL